MISVCYNLLLLPLLFVVVLIIAIILKLSLLLLFLYSEGYGATPVLQIGKNQIFRGFGFLTLC